MEKTTYENLKGKFKLPEFSAIDTEFEISVADESSFPLRDIRRKMIEKVETYAELLGDIMQPNAESIINLRECRIFTEEEKSGIYETYKILISLKRRSTEADISADDNKDAEVINEIFLKWKALKKDILATVQKARECWEKETSKKEKLEYLG